LFRHGKPGTAVATDAAASLDGDTPTNTHLLVTAGAEGAIVTRLAAIPRATVTASDLLVWLSKDSGTTKRMLLSELLAAHTVATTTKIVGKDFGLSVNAPLRLEAGDRLYVGTAVTLAAGIVFEAEWGDY
jgi:hypothetical protein